MKKTEGKYINELLFTIYLYLFTLLKVFTTAFPEISTLVLLASTIIIVVISLFYNKMRFPKKFMIILAISIFIIVIEFLTRSNKQTINYVYDYIIYGIITIYLYSYAKNKEIIVRYYTKLSIIVFFILFLDPFNNYDMTETYMVFGYSMLPAFSGMFIGYAYLNKKWIIPLVFISFIQLVFFANRGAILAAIIIVILLYMNKLSNQRLNFKSIVKISSIFLIISISTLFISINAYKIVNSAYQLLSQKGYFSYALFTLSRTLKTGNIAFEMSTRNVIHESAWEFIRDKLFFGNGIGAFHNYYGIYSHNLILDILATFGIVGFFFFLILFIRAMIKILCSSEFDRVFGILILTLAIIPLWFSMNFFVSKEFWVLLMIGFDLNKKSNNSKIEMEMKVKVNDEIKKNSY